jgi:hypothetical protein
MKSTSHIMAGHMRRGKRLRGKMVLEPYGQAAPKLNIVLKKRTG